VISFGLNQNRATLNTKPPQNGKISVKFKPELAKSHKQASRIVQSNFDVKLDLKLDGQTGLDPDLDREKYTAGSTMFGSQSQQSFNMVEAITTYDTNKETTIDAYMVVNNLY
jgi:hypothetical protein